jgi:hypothetical protein
VSTTCADPKDVGDIPSDGELINILNVSYSDSSDIYNCYLSNQEIDCQTVVFALVCLFHI